MKPNLKLIDPEIELYNNFISDYSLFEILKEQTPWKQDRITLYGKEHNQPRLTQWYGDPNKEYVYSGIKMKPLPWTSLLNLLKKDIKNIFNLEFNSVLLNLYRNGEDTVGWHSDNEPELGSNPIILSLSLGEERDFMLRNKNMNQKLKINLENGSVLIMSGLTQKNWEHSLPRRKKVKNPRINLTFRNII